MLVIEAQHTCANSLYCLVIINFQIIMSVCFHLLDNWGEKAKRRHTTGTGRMRHLKKVHRRFKNQFREGTQAISKRKRAEKMAS